MKKSSAHLWPERTIGGTPRLFPLDQIHHRRGQMSGPGSGDMKSAWMPGQKWLCGYILPPFQRGVSWSEGQMIRFIESAALGLHIGTWTYNKADILVPAGENGEQIYHHTDCWLIDGQQRLTALDRFWNNEFRVFGHLWSELEEIRQRRFLMTTFQAFETSIRDEAELRKLYDLMNFGGTPHRPDQRASSDVSCENPGDRPGECRGDGAVAGNGDPSEGLRP